MSIMIVMIMMTRSGYTTQQADPASWTTEPKIFFGELCV